jgi:CheY-like chemotaxis protein/anti-sigma regulatory factor (Ser/Thr protein kinase)
MRVRNVAKILVVEDSSVDRLLIGGLLKKESGWDVEFAVDGREGLNRIDSSRPDHIHPDVIVTDLQMPHVDGLELVRSVRISHPEVPVVLVTSQGSEQIALDALRAGATSFSPKSMLRADLVRTIKQVLEMTKYMRYTHDLGSLPAPKQIAFVLENQSSLIGPTIEHLQGNLPSWSDRDRLQLGMAMDEALVNAMHHGNLEVDSKLRECEDGTSYYEMIRTRQTVSPFCHRRVRVEAEFSDCHICVQISDDGPGFDPSTIPNPTDDDNLHKVSGRGLFLIRSFMDQVAHNQTGNQITMTKLRREPTADCPDPSVS